MHEGNRNIRFLSVFMIAVFVNFMFANTVFTHLHTLPDGTKVTHSHPYIPAGQHSHSANSLSLISSFNSAVISFQGVAPFMLAVFASAFLGGSLYRICLIESTSNRLFLLRAPPVLI